MRFFITGGTGFIGSHFVDLLLNKGVHAKDIVCLVRKDKKWLSDKPIQIIKGDLFNTDALKRGIKGANVVVHSAAMVKGPNYGYFYRNNVLTTKTIYTLSRSAGVRILIILSSLASTGPSDIPLTESARFLPISQYGRSKSSMERMIGLLDSGDMKVVIIRPPVVFGPRDTMSYNIFKLVSMNLMPHIRGHEIYISLIYIADLIEGLFQIIMRLEKDSQKKKLSCYYLSDDPAWLWQDFFNLIGKGLQKKTLSIGIPKQLISSFALLNEQIHRLFKNTPDFKRDKAIEMIHSWQCVSEKFYREIGFRPRVGIKQGVMETIDWYKRHNWL